MRILETFWLEEPGIQIDRQPKSLGAGSAPVQHFGRHEVGPDHHRWIGTHEAADYLGISLDALHRLTAARSIPFAQAAPRARCYFKRDELDEWRRNGERV